MIWFVSLTEKKNIQEYFSQKKISRQNITTFVVFAAKICHF